MARSLVAGASLFCIWCAEAKAGGYYLPDGLYGVVSEDDLNSTKAQAQALKNCFTSFFNSKAGWSGSASDNYYVLDRQALSGGTLRFAKVGSDQCKFDSSTKVEVCEHDGVDGKATYTSLIDSVSSDSSLVKFRSLSEDDLKELKVTGKVSSEAYWSFYKKCESRVDLTRFTDDHATVDEQKRIFDAQSETITEEQWKKIIDILAQ